MGGHRARQDDGEDFGAGRVSSTSARCGLSRSTGARRSAMPFDLMRHDLLMTLKPVPAERVRSIVDELFLPLVTARAAARS